MILPEDTDRLKFAYKALADEVKHRRDSRQTIFRWASTIIVSITGGVVALTNKDSTPISPKYQVALTIAVGALAGFTIFWLLMHWTIQQATTQKMAPIAQKLGIPVVPRPPKPAIGGQGIAIILLAVAAFLAIWAVHPH